MTRSARQIILAILFSLIMVSSVMGPFVGGALAATNGNTQITTGAAIQPDEPTATHDVETVNVSDELAVWERAALRPAVVDRSDAAAAINSQTVFLETTGETASIQTPQEGVFQQGTDVDFELAFQNGADTTEFSGEEFKVLVTRIDAERDTTEVFLDAQNVTVEEVEQALEDVDGYNDFEQTVQDQNEVRFGTVRDFFEGTNEFEQFADSFEANQTLTTERFEQALTSEEFLNLTEFSTASGGEINSSGYATATVSLDKAGTYLMIGHVGGEVYDSDDDRPVFNGTTALSVDAVTAQESASTIDVATTDGEVEAGTNVSVDATANLDADGNVSHSVVVMDENTFSQSNSRVIVDDEFSRDLRTGDVTVNSSIAEIQGVANVEPNVRISGTSIAPDRFSGTVSTENQANSFFDIRNAIVDGFDVRDQAGDAATFNANGETTLNASMTAVGNVTGDETIEVETLEEWETGEYTVLHIAADQKDGNISTNRDTIEIVDSIDTGDGDDDDEDTGDDDTGDDNTGGAPGGGGGGAPGGGADDTEDFQPPEPPADVNLEADETANLVIDDETDTTTATFSEDNAVESITFGFRASGSVNARTLSQEPDATGPAPGSSAAVSQITVSSAYRNSDATVRKRVTRDRLSEIGADAEDLTAFRFADGEWQTLDTEVADENDQRVVVEFQTPGFSYFAVSATGEPTAAIDAPSEIEAGDEVTLDASGSETEYGEIVSYDWSVDGESLSGETATATLDEAGDVSVELTVENDAGETDTASATITVTQVDDGDGTGTGDGDGGDGGDGDDGGNLGLALVLVLFGLLIAGGFIYYLNVQE